MAPQEFTETPPQNSTPNNEVVMSGSTPLPTVSLVGSAGSSGPTNQQIFELLLSLQQNNAKLEARLNEIEQVKSPGFEVVTQKDWQNSDDSSSEFIGAIDQGTTSSRFLIFNTQGEPIAQHQMEFKQIYPNSGYVIVLLSTIHMEFHASSSNICRLPANFLHQMARA